MTVIYDRNGNRQYGYSKYKVDDSSIALMSDHHANIYNKLYSQNYQKDNGVCEELLIVISESEKAKQTVIPEIVKRRRSRKENQKSKTRYDGSDDEFHHILKLILIEYKYDRKCANQEYASRSLSCKNR